ncbi:MAG: hypothetical protein D6746_17165 [Bacteroidetes bacterium]|nr:MAG: hypothetical protein D6746_17165 [Bacteroidota bacterium]
MSDAPHNPPPYIYDPSRTVGQDVALILPANASVRAAVLDGLFSALQPDKWENWDSIMPTDWPFFTDFIGMIAPFSGAAPASWVLCDGATVNASDYPIYSARNGIVTPTFTLPDLRDRFILGEGSNAANTTGGSETVTLLPENMPSHNHPAHDHVPTVITVGTGAPITVAGVSTFATTGIRGNDVPHDNMPPYYVLAYYIYLA